MMMRNRVKWWLAAIAAMGLLIVARHPILRAAGAWLDVGERPQPTDFVLTLPGNESIRPFVAAALMRKGLAHTALILKAKELPMVEDGLRPPTDVIISEVLKRRGVDASRLIKLSRTSGSTFEDAQALREFLTTQPERVRVTIVTSDYHTRRARWVFRRVFGEDADRLAFVSAPEDGTNADNWWLRNKGCRMYVSEYAKLVAYQFLYGSMRSQLTVLLGGAVIVIIVVAWRRGALAATHEHTRDDRSNELTSHSA